MKITGITLIRNGVKLGYPFELCIRQLCKLCDEVIINCGDSDDKTLETLFGLQKFYSKKIRIIETKWDMSNTGDGKELATQINNVLPEASGEWIVYMQADELIHDKDVHSIKEFLHHQPINISQVELYRTYFWENLQTRLQTEEIWLGRIFRKETHEVGGDGMYLIRHSGDVIRSPYWIYHYSRIGNEDKVNTRLRNLDSLFHSEEVVKSFKPFSYKEDSKGKNIIKYAGTHPEGVSQFYGF